MTPSSDPAYRPDEGPERDLLDAYVRGDPDVVREAAPPEPSEAEWDVACRRVHARLNPARPADLRRSWRATLWAGAALVAAAAAAVAWVAFFSPPPKADPKSPELVQTRPPDALPLAPPPREAQSDPLAGFAVLPMASDADVVFERVPGGDGWFPVGVHPLAGILCLATADEVELDDSTLAWPQVTPSPGDAPMIFAAKPR